MFYYEAIWNPSQEFINSWKKKIMYFQFVFDPVKLLEVASNI